MKRIAITSICLLTLTICLSARADVSEKVLKSFKSTFPRAEQVKWEEFTDNYVVNFMSSGIRSAVTYDRDGNFISATRYYFEENLPTNILCKVHKRYPNAKVYGVTEVSGENGADYYIKLEDEKSWTTVKSDVSGSLEQIEKLKKSE